MNECDVLGCSNQATKQEGRLHWFMCDKHFEELERSEQEYELEKLTRRLHEPKSSKQ